MHEPDQSDSRFLTARRFFSRVSGAGVDLLFPPRCPMCAVVTALGPAVCADCWVRLSFITSPICSICGYPLDIAADDGEAAPGAIDDAWLSDGAHCAACLARRPVFTTARSALRYDEASRRLILPFKHADRPDLAALLAPWVARAGRDLATEADWIMPVPLHRWRLFSRRYNQASRLAAHLSRDVGTPVLWGALVRHRPTKSQGSRTAAGRRSNVRGAFSVPARYRTRLHGACVVLVDDVLTTGATVDAAAACLLAAGASRVDVLTVARVSLSGE